jgi:hypothetical protein
LLLRQNQEAIGVVIDGFDEWCRLDLPLEIPELAASRRARR